MRANPCLHPPVGLGRARGAAGSDAAGCPLPVHAHLNLHVFPRTPVCVHSGRGACTHGARALGSPHALPCALAPAHCSQMRIECARAARARTLEHASGWVALLHGAPGSMGWWQRPHVLGDQGGRHGLALGWWSRRGWVLLKMWLWFGGRGNPSRGTEQPPLICWEGEKKPPKPKKNKEKKSQLQERRRARVVGSRLPPGTVPAQGRSGADMPSCNCRQAHFKRRLFLTRVKVMH